MTEVPGKGPGGRLKRIIETPPAQPTLADLHPDDAERLLRSMDAPAGTGPIAQAGWSGHTPATTEAIRDLLAGAAAESGESR